MFAVAPDPDHGLVAGPACSDGLTPEVEQFHAGQGFTWNDKIEAFTRSHDTAPTPADVDTIANGLRDLGQYVISTHASQRRS
ncbi:hypothetical protein [Streptomyces sp. N35]|uniref:hypothetical protein n=1 Tax=Streptomyces sp. N35 TaxID=2795730 RepID=UPI0018F6355B|nr:hypothetical protein [Streptomyces sp. N35]